MDAFEQVVSEILWMEGHWVRTSVKVELTRSEKALIKKPTSRPWELDVVAFQGSTNILRVIECKSYFDSRGVTFRAFDGQPTVAASHYKLFNDPDLREVVLERLCLQLAERGACNQNTEVRLCLACGRIASGKDRIRLHEHFRAQGWELWDEAWLRERLVRLSAGGYENHISAVVAKMILNGHKTTSPPN